MKKLLFTIFILLLVFTGCSKYSSNKTTPANNVSDASKKPISNLTPTVDPAQIATDPDFRNIKWGMSQSEIISIEGEPDEYDATYIAYYGLDVAGLDTSLCYYFNDNDQAHGALYILNEQHTNRTDYVDDYDNIVSALTKKYGNPKENSTNWKDDLYKDDPSDWGMAVCVGHMERLASWDTNSCNIYTILKGDNYEIDTTIVYQSKTIEQSSDDSNSGL